MDGGTPLWPDLSGQRIVRNISGTMSYIDMQIIVLGGQRG